MPRHIFLFSPVTSGTSEILVRQLLEFDRESNEEITMFINSPGGSVIHLLAILDTIDMIKSKVKTVVMGRAASAAASIAAAGDTRLITENGEFMIHEVSTFMMGTTSEIEEDMEQVNKIAAKALKILAKHTGKSVEKLKSVMKKTNKFFDAKEAVRFGLADKVIKTNEAQLLKLSERINVEGYEISYKEQGLSEIQLLREGKFFHPVYGEVDITDDILSALIENFESGVRGIDISIDYTHDNDDGEDPASCWIKELFKQKDENGAPGLFANVEFTSKGRILVKSKEYKYVSADFQISYVTESGRHVPYVLCGGTLTNRPFIKEMNQIKLSEYKPKKEEKFKMDKEALFSALKGFGIDVSALQDTIETLEAKIEGFENKIRELNAMPAEKETEIAALKSELKETNDKLVSGEKDQAFETLVSEGKLLPVQKDKILETFSSAKEISEFYKEAPVVVKIKSPAGNSDEGTTDELTDAEEALVNFGEYTKKEIIDNRTVGKN